MGALEKATEMSQIDYLVETNIVLHDYEHPDSLTNHVSDVLTKLREVWNLGQSCYTVKRVPDLISSV